MSTISAFNKPKYTAREFTTNRNAAIERIPIDCPNWTNYALADLGMTLLDQTCFESDKLDFYLNRDSEECYSMTAQHYKNVIRILRSINWFPSPRSAAEVSVTLTLESSHPTVTYPAQSIIISDTAQLYTLYSVYSAYAAAGTNSIDVVFRHATPVNNYTVGMSNGKPYQIMKIGLKNITDGNTKVYGNYRGITQEWTIVDKFTGRTANERICRLFFDYQGRGTLWFGDNVEGAIPEKGMLMYIDTWTGGGAEGNTIGSGKLTKLLSVSYYINSLTNSESPSGGSDVMSMNKAKLAGPSSVRTNYQPINNDKTYDILMGYPGIYDVDVTDVESNVSARLKPTRFWDMWAYILPDGNTKPNDTFLGKVKKYLYERKLSGSRITPKSAIFYTFDIGLRVTIFDWAVQADVQTAIYTALDDYFSTLKMGIKIKNSDMIALIEDVSGVDHVAITSIVVTRSKDESGEYETLNASTFDAVVMETGEVGYAKSSENNFTITWGTPTVV